MAREAGKGSGRRPMGVSKEVADSNWERIWGNKNTGNSSSMKEEHAPGPEVEYRNTTTPGPIAVRADHVFDPYLTINS